MPPVCASGAACKNIGSGKELKFDFYVDNRKYCVKCVSCRTADALDTDGRTCMNKSGEGCGLTKPLSDFEGTRMMCKQCRQKRKTSVANASKPKPTVLPPMPTVCDRGDECLNIGSGKELMFKFRTDTKKGSWKQRCNSCFNGKKYYSVYREKKMTEDPDSFRCHNNEIRKEWMEANPEKKEEYQEKRRLDPRMRFDMIVHNLKSKNKSDLMYVADRDAFIEKIQKPCHYCDAYNPEIFLCGLDRVDTIGKYTDCNTVPCCYPCNMMKITFHVDEFIGGVKAIARYRGLSTEDEILMNPRLGKETPFIKKSDKVGHKNSPSVLPREKLITLWADECYMCGRTPSLGIDRLDSSLPYDVSDNCRSCCSRCNYMKKDLSEQEFLGQVGRIYKFTSSWVIGDDTQYNTAMFGSRKPVSLSAYNGVTVVFPSHGKAVEILGSEKKLQEATNSQYNQQALAVDDVLTVFRSATTGLGVTEFSGEHRAKEDDGESEAMRAAAVCKLLMYPEFSGEHLAKADDN